MSELVNRSVSIYRRLLFLYPEELRRDFGAEMVLAFAEDLEQAWGDARLAGVAQMWWYALGELITVALPSQRSNPKVLVPLLSLAVVAFVQSAELWVALQRVTHVEGSALADAIQLAVILPSVLSAMVAMVVTYVYSRCPFTVLRLE